jgi:hypothetical protein
MTQPIQPDPIVEDIRRVREEYAARFNFDLRSIFEDLKKQERCSDRTLLSFEPKRKES